ncbi:YdcF family protein [bacterium]|nr:YdcF family protein [bacterium]
MLFVAGKITQALVAPLHWILGVLFLAWLIRKRRPRTSGWLLFVGLVGLYLVCAPWFARQLIGTLESQYPIMATDDLPTADAIVILGGTTYQVQPPRREAEEFNGARVQRGARLFKAGKAKQIVVAGGAPYLTEEGLSRTEADDMAELLIMMGVPASAIIREGGSRNTFENMTHTWGILRATQSSSILLVTSAFHMPRAMALFAKTDLKVIPAPSDPRATGKLDRWRDFFPGPDGLKLTTLAINEWVGLIGYRLLGKL